MNERPNLLFLLSDQHTQKVLGCYGDPVVRTPHIDGLAARGVAFDNAYCAAPICVPSRMSMLTARFPFRQECWTNSDALRSDLPTMAHALGAAGYAPTLVGRLHAIGPDQLHGYAEREVGDHSSNWIGGRPHSMGILDKTNDPFRVSLERSGAGRSSYELHDEDVTEAACAQLERIAERRAGGDVRPFALSVGFMLPHQPYVARPEDYALYEGKVGLPEIPAPAPEHEHPYLARWRAHTDTEAVSEAETIRARTAFYGLVTRLDAMIGRILGALEATGLAESTIVVYASDHGDQIGERGLWWKQTFYDESSKVPVILSWIGRLPQGERRAQVVNLVDLTATLLEATGSPPLPHADGRSFLPVAADARYPWLDDTFSEYCTDRLARWTDEPPVQQRMIRRGRWKLNYYHGYRPQLFDLAEDPQETTDLAGRAAYAPVRDDLVRCVLAEWDPDAVARRIAQREEEKRLIAAWCQQTDPPDAFRWKLRMEDNWLAEAPGS